MNKNKIIKILIDAREFVPDRRTGISRVVEGLVDTLMKNIIAHEFILSVYDKASIPQRLINNKLKIITVPSSFISSEKFLSDMTNKNIALYISPYPKLPLFGCYCPSVHIIHDILDLTHPAYNKKFKRHFDGYRLKRALKRTDLTWYDSRWSLEETRRYAGFVGRNPQVRFPGIDERFNIDETIDRSEVLDRYGLKPGYILVVGNGLPHKNPGVLLKIAGQLNRKIVFAGVNEERQLYWKTRFPDAGVIWIKFIPDEDLPAIIKGAFCLAQPSTAEGYGYPPLEAMACGVPAVVSNIAVLVETTGNNALIADPDTPERWLSAFNALEDKDFYKTQVEKGLRWVKPLTGRNGWQGHISDIEELLKEH